MGQKHSGSLNVSIDAQLICAHEKMKAALEAYKDAVVNPIKDPRTGLLRARADASVRVYLALEKALGTKARLDGHTAVDMARMLEVQVANSATRYAAEALRGVEKSGSGMTATAEKLGMQRVKLHEMTAETNAVVQTMHDSALGMDQQMEEDDVDDAMESASARIIDDFLRPHIAQFEQTLPSVPVDDARGLEEKRPKKKGRNKKGPTGSAGSTVPVDVSVPLSPSSPEPLRAPLASTSPRVQSSPIAPDPATVSASQTTSLPRTDTSSSSTNKDKSTGAWWDVFVTQDTGGRDGTKKPPGDPAVALA